MAVQAPTSGDTCNSFQRIPPAENSPGKGCQFTALTCTYSSVGRCFIVMSFLNFAIQAVLSELRNSLTPPGLDQNLRVALGRAKILERLSHSLDADLASDQRLGRNHPVGDVA